MTTTMLNFFVRAKNGFGPKPQPSYAVQMMTRGTGVPFAHVYYPLKDFEKNPDGGYKKGPDGKKIRKPWDAECWRERVIMAVRKAVAEAGMREPIDGPIRLDLNLYFPRPGYMRPPKYTSEKIAHDGPGDVDNHQKIIFDAITQAGWRGEEKTKLVWNDDCQVADCLVKKWYCKVGDAAGARIEIARMVDPAASLLNGWSGVFHKTVGMVDTLCGSFGANEGRTTVDEHVTCPTCLNRLESGAGMPDR